MNVYDFDKTIYKKDSTLAFFIYCLKKKPRIIKVLPRQVFSLFNYQVGRISKHQFKQTFYSFLQELDDVDRLIESFWDREEKNINQWYLDTQSSKDVIISASPEFLLAPMIRRLGNQKLIASQVDKKTGELLGPNCYGAEKVRRFNEYYAEQTIENFYSDSLSDLPLGQLANNFFLVKKDKRVKQ